MATLRSRTIRLAQSNPDLRPVLLPILAKTASGDITALKATVEGLNDAYGYLSMAEDSLKKAVKDFQGALAVSSDDETERALKELQTLQKTLHQDHRGVLQTLNSTMELIRETIAGLDD
jgi:hypothetical protein